MERRRFLPLGAAALAALALAGCGGGGAGPAVGGGGGVLEVARGAGADRFLRAVEAAGMTETLAGGGPFTLFAPSDGAFTASGANRLDQQGLRELVSFHVVPGQLTTDFLDGMDVNHTTLLGPSLNVDGTDGLRVEGARVLRADLMAANGVVFVIDRVLAP